VVRLVRDDEFDAVGAMLGRAFEDGALSTYMIPDPHDRRRFTPVHLTAYIRAVALAGEVWVSDDLTAAAGWLRPGARTVAPELYAATGVDRLPEVIGEEAWARLGAVFAYVDPRFAALDLPAHWYLTLLGVEPELAGRGAGGAVLAPVLARADEAGVPCYLETYAEHNVGFYARHGFHVAESGTEPSSGLAYWLMVRDPH
jgi:GNAT superfamily N-acetyltransferase